VLGAAGGSKPANLLEFLRRDLPVRPGAAVAPVSAMPSKTAAAGGFTLVEVLVASTTLVVALAALAQLLTMAALATRRARLLTLAAVLAQDKLEGLLPQAAIDGPLSASPPGTLTQNIDRYYELLDASGNAIAGGSSASAAGSFVRRWSIEPLSTTGPPLVAMQVVIAAPQRFGTISGEARVVGIVRAVP
jgi:hypothetical protein